MSQPVQHQTVTPRCARVFVVEPSKFFTRGCAYGVVRWAHDAPQVRNDAGSLTWLLERRWWAPEPEPMTLRRSQELLHARYRAERAAQADV